MGGNLPVELHSPVSRFVILTALDNRLYCLGLVCPGGVMACTFASHADDQRSILVRSKVGRQTIM